MSPSTADSAPQSPITAVHRLDPGTASLFLLSLFLFLAMLGTNMSSPLIQARLFGLFKREMSKAGSWEGCNYHILNHPAAFLYQNSNL